MTAGSTKPPPLTGRPPVQAPPDPRPSSLSGPLARCLPGDGVERRPGLGSRVEHEHQQRAQPARALRR
ncbi:hypothetical protein ACWCSH_35825, partial [Streptosporangium sp. NPDC001682]